MNLLIETEIPIVSIDIPSGWDVEKGPGNEKQIEPHMLISLTGDNFIHLSILKSDMQLIILLQLQNYVPSISKEFIIWVEDSFQLV